MHDSNNKFISICFGCIASGLPATAKLLQLFNAGHKFSALRQVNYRLQFSRLQCPTDWLLSCNYLAYYVCIPVRSVMFPAFSSINNNLNLFNRFLKSLMRCDCCHAIAVITNFRCTGALFSTRALFNCDEDFHFVYSTQRYWNAQTTRWAHKHILHQLMLGGTVVWATLSKSFSIVRQMILITTYINT